MSAAGSGSQRSSVPRTPASSVASAAPSHAPVNRTLEPQVMGPSTFGYHTTRPMHREAVRVMHDRDKREKTRAADGAIPTTTNPLVSQGASAGFVTNAERLRRDIPSQRSHLGRQRKAAKASQVKHLGEQGAAMDAQRWAKMEAEAAKAEREAKAVAGTGLRNKGSTGYNLLNGTFGNSDAAAQAKYYDDQVEHTAKVRMQALDRRGNTDFNVVTGQPRYQVIVPPPPSKPEGVELKKPLQ